MKVSCPVPHPVRGADGLTYADDLEVVGSHASEAWVRCRRCGAWSWLSTDIGSKYEYVGAVTLDTALAERAFVHGDLDAIAEVVVTHHVPYGPVWTTASAMVEMFCALTPGATDAARARALGRRSGGPLWDGAAKLFAKQARGRARAAPAPLPFPTDVRLPGYRIVETHEIGSALVMIPDAKTELLRLDATGLVRLPLAGPARSLASRRDAVVLAVTTPAGDAILVLDGAGNATAVPPSTTSYAVTPLDDGWWLFVPCSSELDRWIELRFPDGRPRVKFPRRFSNDATWMPPARRFADGWIVSNLVDDDGAAQALTLFDAEFKTAAYSAGIDGERTVTPIDDVSFWASVDGTMERWVRRERSLERVQSFPQRSCWLVGDRLIADVGTGAVVARGPGGQVLWTWHRATTGATYGVATTSGVLMYDDTRADLLDRDGRLVTSFAVENPDVRVGSDGTAYVKAAADLWVVRDDAHSTIVTLACELETTCGDDALLSCGAGRFELVARDDRRAGFTASGAAFSVVGTVGGPYVVENERIRVARFA
ncbi:MAG TPA: hypothetical protein VF316_16290 [Polyangiaceae bacterium]